jgi:ATP-binding cassette subfamily C (CFTR/MRP) protein 1
LLAIWIQTPLVPSSVLSACSTVAAALGVSVLVVVEHTKTVRPSTLTSLYLLTAILVGGTELRTLHLRGYVPIICQILAGDLVVKAVLLILESQPKQRILKLGTIYSPEETSGVFNRAVLQWLNPFFRKGYSSILTQQDVFPLDERLRSANIRDQMVQCWENSEWLFQSLYCVSDPFQTNPKVDIR